MPSNAGCLVSVVQEKSKVKQSRYYFSGSSLDLSWEYQTRTQTVTTTRYKGRKADIESLLDEFNDGNAVMRKSDGPYYELDRTETTNTPWVTEQEGD